MSDQLFKKERQVRQQRKEKYKMLKRSHWLIVGEGVRTEYNYFTEAVDYINKKLPIEHQLQVKVVGMGKNTTSLVESTIELENKINKHAKKVEVPYGKIFVVFDKDDFTNDAFNQAVARCESNGYIACWSNQAIEFWFLLHFKELCGKMHRSEYIDKLNECFQKINKKMVYQKKFPKLFSVLYQYGSLQQARIRAEKLHKEFVLCKESPAKCESCTLIYRFFDEIDRYCEERNLPKLDDLKTRD